MSVTEFLGNLVKQKDQLFGPEANAPEHVRQVHALHEAICKQNDLVLRSTRIVDTQITLPGVKLVLKPEQQAIRVHKIGNTILYIIGTAFDLDPSRLLIKDNAQDPSCETYTVYFKIKNQTRTLEVDNGCVASDSNGSVQTFSLDAENAGTAQKVMIVDIDSRHEPAEKFGMVDEAKTFTAMNIVPSGI